jgi:hypothetical protein
VATDPTRHPFDDEIEEMLSADPEFAARVRRTVEQYRRGELNLVEHADVLERMRSLGVPLDEGPAPGESPPSAPRR